MNGFVLIHWQGDPSRTCETLGPAIATLAVARYIDLHAVPSDTFLQRFGRVAGTANLDDAWSVHCRGGAGGVPAGDAGGGVAAVAAAQALIQSTSRRALRGHVQPRIAHPRQRAHYVAVGALRRRIMSHSTPKPTTPIP